ncbi:muscle, skeletal receptor tyrosine protein kinase-like isoform X1 [Lethenteron reissneri]|uniref:muscle, skeletal receptor tyrosine protein kinase-like isoform X1 n=2 Tax=Lethenteron reissneri TaxID=7753 RepID=UPI002AB76EB6|nr:muscle, skeletal receptor tyrosine protein kinase-like isoform X1 [Lethenteron reissneri]
MAGRGVRALLLWLCVASASPDGPVITLGPENQDALVEQEASFTCHVTASPPAEITWSRNHVPVRRFDARYRLGEGGQLLTVVTVEEPDAGVYCCTASNGHGTPANACAALQVKMKPRVTRPPGDVTVVAGAKVVLPCISMGNPTPAISWTKDNAPLRESSRVSVLASGNLRVRGATRTDGGLYRCAARNSLGVEYSRPALLTVNEKSVDHASAEGPARMLQAPEAEYQVRHGAELVLLCRARGLPPPTLTWTRDAAPLPPELSPEVVTRGAVTESWVRLRVFLSANFACRADNIHGSAEARTRVSLQGEGPGSPGEASTAPTTPSPARGAVAPAVEVAPARGGVGGGGTAGAAGAGGSDRGAGGSHGGVGAGAGVGVGAGAGGGGGDDGGRRGGDGARHDAGTPEHVAPPPVAASATHSMLVVISLVSGLGATALLVLLGAAVCNAVRRQQQQRHKERQDGPGERAGPPCEAPSNHVLLERIPPNPMYQRLSSLLSSRLQSLEYPRNNIQYVRDIGQGAFGRVFQARAPGLLVGEAITMVAVKMLKEEASPDMQANFHREAALMAEFTHPNIVKLLGVCAVGKPFCLLFEFMPHGDLNEYLRRCSSEAALAASSPAAAPTVTTATTTTQGDRSTLSAQSSGSEPVSLCCADKLFVATQVAAGMAYLAERKFVHRDLATRNCLVGNRLVVKISDFGLSQSIYAADYYKANENDAIPIRWMPPESIFYNRYTSESDVWAFGVVLWEIFSNGLQPYFGMSHEEVIYFVRDGNVLACPDGCPLDLYNLMRLCWAHAPADRPSFASVQHVLARMHAQLTAPAP